MLVVETIAKIRRWYFQEGRPIKQICRDLGVSRSWRDQERPQWGVSPEQRCGR